jgi:hypothetical protein
MSRTNPSPTNGDTTQEGIALEHDVAETLTGFDHVARCPVCGIETLWSQRAHLTHRDDCPGADR